jgi:hypothetical protein
MSSGFVCGQDAAGFNGADPIMGGCLKMAYPQRSRCAMIRWETIAAVNWSLSWTRFRPLFRSAKATDPAMSLGSAGVSFPSSGMARRQDFVLVFSRVSRAVCPGHARRFT